VLTEVEKSVVQFVLQEIFDDERLSRLVFCKEVTSEADTEALAGSLPLIYIWNEDRQRGTFSISINGPILDGLIETLLPRDHPSFKRVRDEVTSVLAIATQRAVVSTCEKAGALPSDVFRSVERPG
jgi:hypothetical protein